MSDTPITRQAFNEAEKLSTFAHQRRFLFDKMEIMERENAKLRNAVRNMMLSLGAGNPEQAKWTGEAILQEIP